MEKITLETAPMTVAVTGRRPKYLWGYVDRAPYTALYRRIEAYFEDLAREAGGLAVVTGGAQGVDQVAGWAGVAAQRALAADGVPVLTHVDIPFAGQGFAWRDTGMFGTREWTRLIEASDEAEILVETYTPTCLNDRNAVMVDRADRVLAVTDDLGRATGGTAHAVRYARERGLAIDWLDVSDPELPIRLDA